MWQALRKYVVKQPMVIMHAACLLACTVQMMILANNQMNPSQTISYMVEKSLDSIEFPALFKICIKPAFNIAELRKAGYRSIWAYFLGQSRYNKSLYGWGGHYKNGSSIASVAGSMPNVKRLSISIVKTPT